MGISSAMGPSALLPGLVLVKTQTIGSAVSSVTVSDVFSSSYDSYRITINGGAASGTTYLNFRVGTSSGADNGSVYQVSFLYTTFTNTAAAAGVSNATYVQYAGSADSTAVLANITLDGPNIAGRTFITAYAAALGSFSGQSSALVNTTTQYTHFTVYPNAGTLTGGTIRVYGYRNTI